MEKDKNAIAEEVVDEIANTLDIDKSKLALDKTLKEDLNITSAQKMVITGIMEDMTGKTVTYGKMNKCKTIGDIVDFVVKNS